MLALPLFLVFLYLLWPAPPGAQCEPEPRIPVTSNVSPGLDVESLVSSADIVVLGTLDDLCNRGKTSLYKYGPRARLVTGRISVRDVLKGPSNLEAIVFQSPVVESSILRVGKPHRYGIFFFKYRGAHIIFASPFYPLLLAVVAPCRAVSHPLDAVVEAWSEVLRWQEERLQLKDEVTFWLGVTRPASRKTIEGLMRALDDQDIDIRQRARSGLNRMHVSVQALTH